jgi:hypothetical protein
MLFDHKLLEHQDLYYHLNHLLINYFRISVNKIKYYLYDKYEYCLLYLKANIFL